MVRRVVGHGLAGCIMTMGLKRKGHEDINPMWGTP
jgi:monoamine oxidase